MVIQLRNVISDIFIIIYYFYIYVIITINLEYKAIFTIFLFFFITWTFASFSADILQYNNLYFFYDTIVNSPFVVLRQVKG